MKLLPVSSRTKENTFNRNIPITYLKRININELNHIKCKIFTNNKAELTLKTND